MKPANILALDIAFGAACACIMHANGGVFLRQTDSDKPHSQAIMTMLASLLAEAGLTWRELDLLACGVGPGSFTGLRIAAATIAGINAGLKLPVLELSSLAISAAQADCEDELYVVEDARAGFAYLGHYRRFSALSPDACLPWKQVATMPQATCTSLRKGPEHPAGWRYLPPRIMRPEAMAAVISARRSENTDALPRIPSPAYLNPSQAERNAVAHA